MGRVWSFCSSQDEAPVPAGLLLSSLLAASHEDSYRDFSVLVKFQVALGSLAPIGEGGEQDRVSAFANLPGPGFKEGIQVARMAVFGVCLGVNHWPLTTKTLVRSSRERQRSERYEYRRKRGGRWGGIPLVPKLEPLD